MTTPNYIRDPQLGLFDAKPGDANVVWLETLLKAHGGWMTRRQIVEACGGRIDERQVRSLANASEWILSGPGSPGYRHVTNSNPEEINHYSNANISQGKKMIARGIAFRRRAHQTIG